MIVNIIAVSIFVGFRPTNKFDEIIDNEVEI